MPFMTLKRTVISGALLSTMLGAAAPAAADDGPGVEMLTRFSQLPRIYEANPSNPVPVRLKGVVTYVFPDVCDGFVIADEQHYDRGGLVVRPCDAGKQLSGALELEVGETVVVSGETVYENRTVGLSAVNVLRAGRMELSEPPPLKLSDFRRGLRHLRRNRVEGVVAGCVDQPRADAGPVVERPQLPGDAELAPALLRLQRVQQRLPREDMYGVDGAGEPPHLQREAIKPFAAAFV